MDHITRRNQEIAYISDQAVMEQQVGCRKILQKLNFMDRSDFAGFACSGSDYIVPAYFPGYGIDYQAGDQSGAPIHR